MKCLPEVMKICKKLGVDEFRLMRLIPLGKANIKDFKDYIEKYEILIESLFNCFVKLNGNSIEVEDPILFYNELVPKELKTKINFVPCPCGKSVLVIFSDGSLSSCPLITPHISVGNILKDDIKQIWKNHWIFKYARKPEDHACKKCKYIKVCYGGCRCSALAVLKKYKAPDPICPNVRRYYDI